MGLFSLFGKKREGNSDFVDYESNEILNGILDMFFDFEEKCKGKIVCLDIYPSKTIRDRVAFDISFIFDGKVEWYVQKDREDLFEFFREIECDGTFTTFQCTIDTYEYNSNYEYIKSKLRSNIKSYMITRPDKIFEFRSSGATIKYW